MILKFVKIGITTLNPVLNVTCDCMTYLRK